MNIFLWHAENIVNQRICRYIFTSIPQILLFHGCLLGKGFSLSFVVSYFSITWPMNDSGATVFIANSHSFFITAVSWKTSSVLDHPARAWLHFHHWWMKCNAGILLLCMLRFPDARCLLFFFLMALLYIAHNLHLFGKDDTLSFTHINIRNAYININSYCFVYLRQKTHMVYFALTTHANAFQWEDKCICISNWLCVDICS